VGAQDGDRPPGRPHLALEERAVWLGAALIAASLLIMAGLLGNRAEMAALMPVETWFVLFALLAPVGYVHPGRRRRRDDGRGRARVDADGKPIDDEQRRLMHTTMQTLGRVAIIGGGVVVALVNVVPVRRASEAARGRQGRAVSAGLHGRC
jgi:hypothetical protein